MAVLAAINCANRSTGTIAITDLGSRTYQGEQGGLYPGGSNVPPPAYRAAGIQAARSVVPLDKLGRPSPSGRIVFMSIGMSNTSMEFQYFAQSEANDAQRNPVIAMVDGAQGGKPAAAWTNSSDGTWAVVDQTLTAAGLTDRQVEVVWLKQADAFPTSTFETYAHGLQAELAAIVTIAAQRYPNLHEVFVSPRTYGGYGVGGANPEPYAYETGFADKFLVAQWVANPSRTPWVGWGPYLWTDGTLGRADGLKWYCSDTVDGTHPSASGLRKLYPLMHSLFLTSSFSPWFGLTQASSPPKPSLPPGTTAKAPPRAAQPIASKPVTAGAPQPRPGTIGSQPAAGTGGIISAIPGRIALIGRSMGWLEAAAALLLIAAFITVIARLLGRRRRRLTALRKEVPLGGGGSGPPGGASDARAVTPVPRELVGAGHIKGRDSEGPGRPLGR